MQFVTYTLYPVQAVKLSIESIDIDKAPVYVQELRNIQVAMFIHYPDRSMFIASTVTYSVVTS